MKYRHACVAALGGAILVAAAAADVVYTQDGRVFRGRVERKGDKVLIVGPLATISIDAKDVAEIIRSSAPPPSPAKPPAPAPPAVTVPGAPPDPETFTRPEPHVFLLMRQRAGTAPGALTADIDRLIRTWRARTHDRLRKFRNRWISPEDMTRARGQYAEVLKKAQPLLSEIRRAGSVTSSGRARQAQLRRALGAIYRKAAAVWPDELMQEFLLGVANLEGMAYPVALRHFQKCIDAAPRVAGFRQGKALALAGQNKPIAALAACVEVLELMPDSRDAYDLVVAGMEQVPGERMTDPTYRLAAEILTRYETPPGRSYSRPGITWLMPPRPWLGREFALPTPPYDRLVFRQAVGVPVGPHALIVDAGVLAGAHEAFVRIDANTVVTAGIQRVGSYGLGEEARALGLLRVADFTFTPVKPAAVAPAVGQAVRFFGLGLYEEMGGRVRAVDATVSQAGPGGVRLTAGLLPGEVLGPVLTKDGLLAGFLAPRTDPLADGGGPDRFLPISAAGMLLKRAAGSRGFYGGYGRIRRKVIPRPAAGEVFVVHVTASEGGRAGRF